MLFVPLAEIEYPIMMTLKSLTGGTGLLRLDRLLEAAPHIDSGQWIGAGSADSDAHGNATDVFDG